jgi:hypothetical protein
MASKRPRRTALATGLSLVLHVLALTGMVVGLKTVAPPPEDRAVELELIPALQHQPEPAHEPPGRGRVALPPGPHLAPAPEAPVATLPEAPTPTPAPQPEAAPQPGAGLKGFSASLSGRMGCDDALGFHLTSAQRQVCDDNLARLAQNAKPLPLLRIPDRKKAAYDRNERCRDFIRNAPIVPPSQQVSETGGRFTLDDASKCPVVDRMW